MLVKERNYTFKQGGKVVGTACYQLHRRDDLCWKPETPTQAALAVLSLIVAVIAFTLLIVGFGPDIHNFLS